MCDDMENDELVMNKERRDKMRRWFKGALLPCRADNGVVRIVGTILHNDSLLERLMPNESDKLTFRDGLKTYTTRKGMWKAVKYRAHNEDFTELLWASKKSAAEFKMLYEEAVKDGTTDIYSQEYLNIPLDESISFFKKADFLKTTDEHRQTKMHHYVTADLAISESEKADFSVFILAGVDENKIIHVKDVIRERMDGKEIVDTLLMLQQIYDPEAVGIEDMQVSKAIGPFLREEMVRRGIFVNLMTLKLGGKDKIARAKSIQGRMRANAVKFDKAGHWYPAFEEELCKFPRGSRDDQVDAFAYIGMMLDSLIEAPTQYELDEEEYQNELHGSESWDDGRNVYTGY
jgi:predicted phage terminase large subunit-like protein